MLRGKEQVKVERKTSDKVKAAQETSDKVKAAQETADKVKADQEKTDKAKVKAAQTIQECTEARNEPKEEVRVSVRNLVEFILRHGDIDNRIQASPEGAMREGGRIHRMIQRRMGAQYRAEVPLRYKCDTGNYILFVEGRADGIFSQGDDTVIDEIKGTYRELNRFKDPLPLHLAQAKCYAYMYGIQEKSENIRVRLTYCHIPTEELRYFYQDYTLRELEEWFGDLIDAYRKWADYTWEWRKERQSSISGLAFPFPYREGQRELAADVYRTIYHGKKLFLEAPTGVGKTVSTIFPAVQAVGKGLGDKIFYLTAKTITRTVAEDTISLLRDGGLKMKSVILTAKDKICFMDKTDCNPEFCPYAKGHYDRINKAMYDLLVNRESFSREQIQSYAKKHQVCPFEFCLDMSLYADAVICDYNYLFDPNVYLRRFFGDSAGGSYIFLIDEAHNLLDRGREMYSASIYKEQFQSLKSEIKKTIMSELSDKSQKSVISGQLTLDVTQLTTDMSHDIEMLSDEEGKNGGSNRRRSRRRGKSMLVRQGYGEKLIYHLEQCNREMLALKRECETACTVQEIDAFVQKLLRLHSAMDDYLSVQEEEKLPLRETLLDFFFEVSHFLEIYELVDESYVKYTQMQDDGGFLLKLFCVNPAENLKRCMAKGRSAILFSATLLPIQYYKKLLGGDSGDYEVYARSVFNPEKRALFIAGDVTSKYTRRSEEEYEKIAEYIEEIVKNRHGNYMVFCPSYSFLRSVYSKYVSRYGGEGRECIMQNESMSEADREEFLAMFRAGPGPESGSGGPEIQEDRILIGFCVLGGSFGEGIDLKNDSLIGAVIVGTGLPQVCYERELLRRYFEQEGEDGFDYAYRYPGMNKILQAAGRVIRTAEDVGIIALLDERFLQGAYSRLFPREWEFFETVKVETVAKRVEKFWDSWL